jgi:hypothetical protein
MNGYPCSGDDRPAKQSNVLSSLLWRLTLQFDTCLSSPEWWITQKLIIFIRICSLGPKCAILRGKKYLYAGIHCSYFS